MYNQGYTPQQPQQGYPYYPQAATRPGMRRLRSRRRPQRQNGALPAAPAVEEPAVEKSLKKSAA